MHRCNVFHINPEQSTSLQRILPPSPLRHPHVVLRRWCGRRPASAASAVRRHCCKSRCPGPSEPDPRGYPFDRGEPFYHSTQYRRPVLVSASHLFRLPASSLWRTGNTIFVSSHGLLFPQHRDGSAELQLVFPSPPLYWNCRAPFTVLSSALCVLTTLVIRFASGPVWIIRRNSTQAGEYLVPHTSIAYEIPALAFHAGRH